MVPVVEIRRAVLEDILQIHSLDALTSALPWSERSYRFELTDNPAARIWVASQAGNLPGQDIDGFLVLWLLVDEAHVSNIAVHPDRRRQGIAKRLLATGLLELHGEGARSGYLEARRGNLSALALYQLFGFVESGVRKRYYRDNREDALLMELPSLDPDRIIVFLKT
jgi:[ribosomal protein S18]-alanine N-acetyltransferase